MADEDQCGSGFLTMGSRRRNRLGNATIEFTLVGIPLLCVLISTFEMARGMWIYHTLAYAVNEGARFTIVRGQNNPNPVALGAICNYIVQQGAGLDPHQLSLSFTSFSATLPPVSADTCSNNTTVWPPNGQDVLDNLPGQRITITATYPFQSSILLFWPGVNSGTVFPTFNFPAQASEVMQF
jgi:Flp pilus assembly protein TadG